MTPPADAPAAAALHGVRLRPARAGDALCLGVLAMQVFLDTYALDGIRPTLAREALQAGAPDAMAQALAEPGTRFVLAERDGHLVGFAQLRLHAPLAAHPGEAAAELHRLYVQRPFLGAGVGSALLGEAARLAAAAPCPLLWLTVYAGNARARAFYRRHGFEDAGRTSHTFEGESHENRLLVRGPAAERTQQ